VQHTEFIKTLSTHTNTLALALAHMNPHTRTYALTHKSPHSFTLPYAYACTGLHVNGLVTHDYKGQVQDQFGIPNSLAMLIMKFCLENDLGYCIYSGTEIVADKSNPLTELLPRYHEKVTIYEDLGARLDEDELPQANKVLILANNVTMDMEKLQETLKEVLYQEGYSDEVDFTNAVSDQLEIMPKGYNKATALIQYCAKNNIDINRVIAFGDGNNDVEMLQSVGLGIAMGNAVPSAVDAADIVTKCNANHGVADFCKKYVLR